MASPARHSPIRRALTDTALVAVMAGLAVFLYSMVEAASANPHWHVLIFPPLGSLAGIANFLIAEVLPGVPYLVAARRAWIATQACGASFRNAFRVVIVLLSIPSLWWIWNSVWFVLVLFPYGGRF